ncbi:MAG: putative hydro-lyase [Gammaproteobacteria bacterium]|nr:putative hydro-lyase [Gammaproteobacteria bacterium]
MTTNLQTFRQSVRQGEWTLHTSGVLPGHLQGNVVILPSDWAQDFYQFCLNNPKPCPIIGMSEVGDPRLPALGLDLDIRIDVPKYRIWQNGKLVSEVTDIKDYWNSNLVAFVLGCSFTFESALVRAGIPLRHLEHRKNVAMYNTTLALKPSARFWGNMVVSMRPLTVADTIRAIEISSRLPQAHGAPVHFGSPNDIGIADLQNPEYGESVEILSNELPVFWACGVTPQQVLTQVKPPFCITHAPGCMLLADVQENFDFLKSF